MSTTDTHDDADLLDRLATYHDVLDDAIAADVLARGLGVPVDDRRASRRRGPLLVAACVVIAVVGAVGLVAVDARRSSAPAPAVVSSAPDDPGATPDESVVGPLLEPLSLGSDGEQVRVLQRRLDELGFVAGPDDGVFGELTRSAVWAFEKLVLGVPAADATGVVDERFWDALHGDVDIVPRGSPSSMRHVEVWLPEQVVGVFDRQGALLVTHASTGSGEQWCDAVTIDPGESGNEGGQEPLSARRCGIATTPGGTFTVHRRIEGLVRNGQGELVDPVYFIDSVAIGGAADVPLDPVSRGSVRVPLPVIRVIHELVDVGTPVWVFDGEHDPEVLGQQLPVFDWPEPTRDVGEQTLGEHGIVAIGDSVMLGAAARLSEFGVVVDAMESRQMFDVVPVAAMLPSLEPTAVVVHVGTNGPIQAETLDTVLGQVADVPYVVVLTVRANRSWTARNNELIRAGAIDRPNVIVVDWAELADQCPGDCFASDGIHLRRDGVEYYTRLIADILGLDG